MGRTSIAGNSDRAALRSDDGRSVADGQCAEGADGQRFRSDGTVVGFDEVGNATVSDAAEEERRLTSIRDSFGLGVRGPDKLAVEGEAATDLDLGREAGAEQGDDLGIEGCAGKDAQDAVDVSTCDWHEGNANLAGCRGAEARAAIVGLRKIGTGGDQIDMGRSRCVVGKHNDLWSAGGADILCSEMQPIGGDRLIGEALIFVGTNVDFAVVNAGVAIKICFRLFLRCDGSSLDHNRSGLQMYVIA